MMVVPAQAERDALTGLMGPDAARRRLENWLADGPVHALLLVITRLDTINLAWGSSVGDGALAEVAGRIVQYAGDELDSPWFSARMGGGSFLIAAREACSRERWALLAEGLAESISRPIAALGEDLRLYPRIALLRAVREEDAVSVLDRLGQAQAALARKTARRIGWVDGAVNRKGLSVARLEADLLKAIDRDEIEILFQPQFALPGDELTGAEALARWRHPQVGRIGAGALFAIAERADHVAQLSRHIAAKACSLAAQWPERLSLSVNVTAADLAAEVYPEQLGAIVAASGLAPSRLVLEVTEQALLGDIGLARRSLGRLVGAGVAVALDDFGAGFCNFRYLKLLPLQKLKLDRAMVEGIAEDPRDLAVLRGIVAMAGALDLEVTAEGIETAAQRAAVEAEGCASWQGFLGAEPMDAAAFLALARR
ncbi:bifunctional diguanylate cyclase/phosphodiesterase [Novosphingobium sp. TH158]|uniref:bifunctional diguanylate cyclase/phosphodiesterase n=1 Tax=Novosphingobium sp. TH158 TaxID=2067455 RepID=UPI000C7C326E|nr:bifunctional diguanylate cyclase/phosphodiesterase [Novosphingobium sp. TH158]PLK26263.1 GGDEF domain-containing protein [Novosphingobium sp. TH158]